MRRSALESRECATVWLPEIPAYGELARLEAGMCAVCWQNPLNSLVHKRGEPRRDATGGAQLQQPLFTVGSLLTLTLVPVRACCRQVGKARAEPPLEDRASRSTGDAAQLVSLQGMSNRAPAQPQCQTNAIANRETGPAHQVDGHTIV